VRKALRDLYRGYGEAFWRARNEQNVGNAVAPAFKGPTPATTRSVTP